MTVDKATERLLALLDSHGGYLSGAMVEADEELAASQETVSAAAHALATEPDIAATSDGESWFPFASLERTALDAAGTRAGR
jgi:hypothetical protein